jgi:2-C-methyl-D-erythritol 4-phosphate cytidylyltransferase
LIGLVLAAAGSGQRFGSEIPKQFIEFEDRPLYLHAFARVAPFCRDHVIVASPDQVERVREQLRQQRDCQNARVVAGGSTRQESVWNGVQALHPEVSRVLIHDGVRPFVSPELVERVLRALDTCGACVPARLATETIKQVEGRLVVRTLDRSRLVLVQTPQGFERRLLTRALEWALRQGIQGTDEAYLVEQLGETVVWVEGDPANLKITWPDDLEIGLRLWQNRESSPV